MNHLKENEIRALRWLEREFPISTTPKWIEWTGVVKGLSEVAGLEGDAAVEAMIETLRRRDLVEGGRAEARFTGSITVRGQEVIRELDAKEAERRAQGSVAKRFLRYFADQTGPILIHAFVGIAIGATIGWVTGTLQSAVLTGLASATAAGRVPEA